MYNWAQKGTGVLCFQGEAEREDDYQDSSIEMKKWLIRNREQGLLSHAAR